MKQIRLIVSGKKIVLPHDSGTIVGKEDGRTRSFGFLRTIRLLGFVQTRWRSPSGTPENAGDANPSRRLSFDSFRRVCPVRTPPNRWSRVLQCPLCRLGHCSPPNPCTRRSFSSSLIEGTDPVSDVAILLLSSRWPPFFFGWTSHSVELRWCTHSLGPSPTLWRAWLPFPPGSSHA